MQKELVSYLQAYKENVKANLNDQFYAAKKISVANIIQAGNKILLLKRSPIDTFHGGTWCLPGGGVEKGEAPYTACLRETSEEAGLMPEDYRIFTTWVVKLKDINIVYYCGKLVDASKLNAIILNNAEHVQYQWCTPAQWMQLDLILDLKEHLLEAMA